MREYCLKYFPKLLRGVCDGLIKSLLNQTLGEEKLEIVLVDDGSPDDTYEKLQQYEQGAPATIVVIHCGENGGFFEICSKEDRQNLLETKDLGGYWAAIYKHSMLLEKHIIFPVGLLYDDNFFSGLVHFYGERYYFHTGKMYHRYINNQSVSMGNNLTKHTDRLKVELLLLEELGKRGVLEEYYDNVEALFLKDSFCILWGH